MPVNPQSYRANYSGLDAFDIMPNGRIGDIVSKAIDRKEARDRAALDSTIKKKAYDDSVATDDERKDYITKMEKNRYMANMPEELKTPQEKAEYESRFKPSNSYTEAYYNMLKDERNFKEKKRVNNSDISYKKIVGDAASSNAETNKDKLDSVDEVVKYVKDGEVREKLYNAKGKEVGDYSAYVKPVKTNGSKNILSINDFANSYVASKLKNIGTKPTQENIKSFLSDKKNLFEVVNAYKTAGGIPTKGMVNTVVDTQKIPSSINDDKVYSEGQEVKASNGSNLVAVRGSNGNIVFRRKDNSEYAPRTLNDYIDDLRKKGKENQADILENTNKNLFADKYTGDRVYNAIYQLTDGDPKSIENSFDKLKTYDKAIRAGGVTSALASMFPELVEWNEIEDGNPTSRNANVKQVLDANNLAVLGEAIRTGRVHIDKAGGINPKTGMYRYYLTDMNGRPVTKKSDKKKVWTELKQDYKKDSNPLYPGVNHSDPSSFINSTSRHALDVVNPTLSTVKSLYDMVTGNK